MRQLHRLWLVPTLTFAALGIVFVALNRLPSPLWGRIWLGLAVLIFIVACSFVHRRAAFLTDAFRIQATQERQDYVDERTRLTAQLERRASAEQQRARETEAMLTSLRDGVVLCNADGQMVSANGAARTLLGADGVRPGESVAEWASRVGLCYPSGQPVPPGGVPLAHALREGRMTDRADFLISTGGQVRIVEITATPLPESAGAVAVLRDITDLRRSQGEEAAAQARAAVLLDMSRRLNATLAADAIDALVTEGALALLPDTGQSQALLYELDSDGKRLVLQGISPDPRPKRPRTRKQAAPNEWPFDAQSPFLWTLYVSRQPVICGNVATDPHFAAEADRAFLSGGFPGGDTIKSVLALPLVAGKQADGHMVVTSPRPDAFADVRLQDAFCALASLAALARTNAALHGETRRSADELDLLWSVSQATAALLALGELADALTERVRAVFGAELCTLSVWKSTATGERRLVSLGKREEDALLPGEALTSAPGCDGCEQTTLQAAQSGEPAVCLGVANPPFGECRLRAFSGQSGVHSILAAPLRQGRETLGALTVYRDGGAPFTPNQTKLLETFAGLAAAAVKNASATGNSAGRSSGS